MKEEGSTGDRLKRVFGWSLIVIVVAVALFGALFALTMFVNVGVGYAVVLVDPWANTVSEPTLGPSWVVKAPWVQPVKVYYATDSFEDVIPCFSSDQLEMQIQVLMRWSLDPAKIPGLYRSYPSLNYKETAIQSIMQQTIRLVTKNYTALETIEFRDVVVDAIEQAVFQQVIGEPSLEGALISLELDVKNIGYPISYTSAIESKLVAQQQKIQAEFERDKIVIIANATAQQVIIEANAEAGAKILVANATKEAIELIVSATGGDASNSTRIAELYLWIETLKQIAPDIDLFLMTTGEDGIPILVSIPTNSTG